jgi:hypothetical protein
VGVDGAVDAVVAASVLNIAGEFAIAGATIGDTGSPAPYGVALPGALAACASSLESGVPPETCEGAVVGTADCIDPIASNPEAFAGATGRPDAATLDPSSTLVARFAAVDEALGVEASEAAFAAGATVDCDSSVAGVRPSNAGNTGARGTATELAHIPMATVGVAPLPCPFPLATFELTGAPFEFATFAVLPGVDQAPVFGV